MLREKLKSFETTKLEGQKVRSRAKWRLIGDRLSSEFFKAVRETPATALITELKDAQGHVHHDREGLETISLEFYSKLYSQEAPSVQTLIDKDAILNYIRNRFTPSMIKALDLPLSKQELHNALLQMAKARNPGPDGILTEFFNRFWDILGDDFYEMVNVSIQGGHLPPGMTSGSIVLLFKNGDRADLANWHPITLLNASYKIVAKSLQIRLQQVLQEVISTE